MLKVIAVFGLALLSLATSFAIVHLLAGDTPRLKHSPLAAP